MEFNSVNAALLRDSREEAMHGARFVLSLLLFHVPLLPPSLPPPSHLCVWHTVKQMARARMTARQKEGGRARGRKRQGREVGNHIQGV